MFRLEVRNNRREIVLEASGSLAKVVNAAYPLMRVVNLTISIEEVGK